MVDPRVDEFERRYGLKLDREPPLGSGVNGFVLSTDSSTAVKFHDHLEAHLRERDTYRDLKALRIIQIRSQSVPEFVRSDDELRAIEMKIVSRPYLLDFASAYPEHEAPEFSPEVLEDERVRMLELFGDDLLEAELVRDEFRKLTGRVLVDMHPGNVAFVRIPDS